MKGGGMSTATKFFALSMMLNIVFLVLLMATSGRIRSFFGKLFGLNFLLGILFAGLMQKGF
jgi:hypothetical protein